MDIYSPIFTRASTRKFEQSTLSADTLNELEGYIANVFAVAECETHLQDCER